MRVIKTGTAPVRGVGSPDYAAPKPVGQVPVGPTFTSTDVGELAARLGSSVTFDRRGNVIFFDLLEENLVKWNIQAALGGSIVISTEASKRGSASAKFTTPNLADQNTALQKFLSLPILSNIGFEFSWMGGLDVSVIRLSAFFSDAERTCEFAVLYTIATEILSLWVSEPPGGTLRNLTPPVIVQADIFSPNTLKLVVNWPNARYERLLINDREFDISSYECPTAGGTATHRLIIRVEAYTGVVSNAIMYVSDFILTQNEPDNVMR